MSNNTGLVIYSYYILRRLEYDRTELQDAINMKTEDLESSPH